MKRTVLLLSIFLLATLILGWVNLAEAQQAQKVYRIGYLSSSGRGFNPRVEAFRKALRELGYIEGKNIVFEWQFAKSKGDRIRERVAKLVHLKVDCIVTGGSKAARAAKKATSTIPIVMVSVGSPVKKGLVTSLARPGGNITGFSNSSPGISGKRMELLQQATPQITRIALLRNTSRRNTKARLREMEVAARGMGVELQSLEVRPPFDFENAFRAAVNKHAEALIVLSPGFVADSVDRIVKLAVKLRLPAMYTAPRFVRAGGLMYYGRDRLDINRRAAIYVDKILKGAKPASLPVEQPAKFDLVINLNRAKQLGITIPPTVLYQATKVIK
jgi:putative ABC transport system substrate-binding protein